MSTAESIRVGCLGSVAWVRIEGAANHENVACIKTFLMDRFEHGWRKYVIDLAACRSIDSTFIGMVYRFATQVDASDPDGRVDVINPGERNANSIRKLGLDNFIHIDMTGDRWRKECELVEENLTHPECGAPLDQIARAELILDAHEALIAANEANRNQFLDVVEFLKQEMDKKRGQEP